MGADQRRSLGGRSGAGAGCGAGCRSGVWCRMPWRAYGEGMVEAGSRLSVVRAPAGWKRPGWKRPGWKRRAALPVTLLAAASLGITACSSSPSPSGAAPSAPPAPTSAAGSPSVPPSPDRSPSPRTEPTGSPDSGSPSSPTGPAAPSSPSSPTRSSRECTTGRLSVALTSPDAAAGSVYATLVFTNKSTTTCTMTGYPGVSYVAKNGVQSGNPAVREPATVATVTLRPGERANVRLRDANGVSGYDPARCKLAPAEGLRIYPPDQTAALFVPWKTEHCAGPTVHALTVGPVQPG
ncbi:DUF4232 domain-containing protein [Streptomyces sp. NPDC020422]|uniref:DUF4232 domain-containing protein n=1 Tax=Streptomyces sp. NPDC020422 TaxID=3365074 RepID=UPI0037991F86